MTNDWRGPRPERGKVAWFLWYLVGGIFITALSWMTNDLTGPWRYDYWLMRIVELSRDVGWSFTWRPRSTNQEAEMLANLSLFCIRLCGRPSPSISFLYDIGMEGKLLEFFVLYANSLSTWKDASSFLCFLLYLLYYLVFYQRKKKEKNWIVFGGEQWCRWVRTMRSKATWSLEICS